MTKPWEVFFISCHRTPDSGTSVSLPPALSHFKESIKVIDGSGQFDKMDSCSLAIRKAEKIYCSQQRALSSIGGVLSPAVNHRVTPFCWSALLTYGLLLIRWIDSLSSGTGQGADVF